MFISTSSSVDSSTWAYLLLSLGRGGQFSLSSSSSLVMFAFSSSMSLKRRLRKDMLLLVLLREDKFAEEFWPSKIEFRLTLSFLLLTLFELEQRVRC